jgi:hypothetical protein
MTIKAKAAKDWDLQAYQDALRPRPDQLTELVVIATYSLDIASLAAALLALVRQDDDDGRGTVVSLVTAVEHLRDRFRVLVQKGQIHKPRKVKAISPLLDQFVLEVSSQIFRSSWHAKASLMKFTSDGQPEWRFWVGSKNLTREEAWDVGLLLISHPLNKGAQIPGLVEAGVALVRQAELPNVSLNKLRRDLENLTWQIPPGVDVKEINWLADERRSYPEVDRNSAKTYIVSPFLDAKTLKHFASGNGQRLLLSLDCELSRIATESPEALAPFDGGIYGMAKPTLETEDLDTESDEPRPPDSLHAKLIYSEVGKRRKLWIGSSNATARGLIGPNTEIAARLEIAEEVAASLEHFIHRQRILSLDEIPKIDEELDDQIRRRLEKIRDSFVRECEFIQERSPLRLLVRATPQPDIPADVELRIGRIVGDLFTWPRDAETLELPPAELHQESELIQVQLQLEGQVLEWLQRAKFSPPLDEDRDASVVRRCLTYQELLELLRTALGNVASDNGRSWDEDEIEGSTSGWSRLSTAFPTLEDVLKTDRARLFLFDRYFRKYSDRQQAITVDMRERERKLFTDFQSMWRTVRTVLLAEDEVH